MHSAFLLLLCSAFDFGSQTQECGFELTFFAHPATLYVIQVGVGAFVFDEKHRSVLVVREKSGPLAGKGVWKIPTGLVMQGEDITEAAVREVEEETGVKARFAAVLAMRQAHGVAFSKSDLFFLVALKPAPGASESPLKPQEDEIEEASWLPLEEYRSQAFTLSRPLLVRLLDRCVAWVEGKYKGLEGAKIESGFSDRQDLLFFGEEEEGRSSMGGQDAWIGVSNDSV
jgi:ADP-ribose pyrophosphatase YjhB (NUDIX family)